MSEDKRLSIGNHLIDTSIKSDSFFRNISQNEGFLDRWIASVNVIYGAILSAYAGISLTKIEVEFFDAASLAVLCFLHTVFLWLSSEIHFADINKSRELHSLRGVLGDFLTDSLLNDSSSLFRIMVFGVVGPGLLLFCATKAWNFLFGETLIYKTIVSSWYVMIVVVPFWIRSRVDSALASLELLKTQAEAQLTRLPTIDESNSGNEATND